MTESTAVAAAAEAAAKERAQSTTDNIHVKMVLAFDMVVKKKRARIPRGVFITGSIFTNFPIIN